MPVNVERVQMLVDALRSGEFKQGYGALEKVTRLAGGVEEGPEVLVHCCLGVACRIAMRNGLRVLAQRASLGFGTRFDDSSGVLPPSVQAWYGFASADPMLASTEGQSRS